MDVAKDICPPLTKVVLPSNRKGTDGSYASEYIWLPSNSEKDTTRCIHQGADLDIAWFEEQLAFLKGLKQDERRILQTYTRNGDEVINIMLRGNPDVRGLMAIVKRLKEPTKRIEKNEIDENGDRIDFPEAKEITERENIFAPTPLDSINETNVVQIAADYVKRFRDVFLKIPVLKKPLRVFRGVDSDEVKVFPLRGFSSTTYDPMGSGIGTYVNGYAKCCVMDITLQPGVRALWIEPISNFPNEREILIDSTSVTTNINQQPYLSAIMTINPYDGKIAEWRKPLEVNVFKCEVTQTKNIATRLTNFLGFTKKGGMYWPTKYHRGLTRRQNAQRKRSATRRANMSFKDPKAYAPWKTDKGIRTRRSSYTSRFHKKCPDAKTLPAISRCTKVPTKTLRTVYNRGMAAWRTGHRPGASQHAWGMARVHSFVLHGKTYRTADADLARKSSPKK